MTAQPVLVHGFALGPSMWDDAFAHTYQRVTLSGHCGAQATATCIDAAADELLAQLPAGAHLVGYSMGGRIALAAALRAGDRLSRLTLIGAHAGIADADERSARRHRDHQLAETLCQKGIDWFVDTWRDLPMWSSQSTVAADRRERQDRLRRSHRAADLAHALRHLGPGTMPSYWSELHRIAVPVDLIAGADDCTYVASARAMAEALPRARVHEIAGCGHNPVLEDPEAVRAIITRAPTEAA